MEQANPFVATFETGRHYKVHKSYVYVAPIVAVIFTIFVVFINGIQGWVELYMAFQSGKIGVNPLFVIGGIILGLAVVIGAFVGLYALAWRNMSYVFDEREFSYYSGIITKRRVHVPYSRVQSVNHRASIIQRLFGVCTVVIDSAGGSTNKGVRVPYLRLETAERMRVELFMRKAAVAAGQESAVVYAAYADTDSAEGAQAEAARLAQIRSQAPVAPGAEKAQAAAAVAVTSWVCPQCGAESQGKFCGGCGSPAPENVMVGSAVQQPNALDTVAGVVGDWRGVYGGTAAFGEEPVTHEFGLTNRELLLTAVSHDTPFAIALIIFFTFMVAFGFMLLDQDDFSIMIAGFAIPIVIISTVATWLIGLLSVFIAYGNFRTRRRGSRIEVERGLLARESSGIDIARVQSIEIRQSFIRRIIGYCEVSLGRIDAAGEQNKGNNNSKMNTKGLVIHPFVKLDQVDEILDNLVPELTDRPRRTDRQALPTPAFRRALLRRCVWYNWVLWVGICICICWAVLAAFVNDGAIHFVTPASQAQYSSFMTTSLVIATIICVAVTVCRGVGAVLWARHSGYIWNQKYLLLYNDGLATSESIIPRQKIQAAATRSNPFQRRLSLVTLHAITAAGTHSTTAKLVDVSAEAGAEYLDWVKPRR